MSNQDFRDGYYKGKEIGIMLEQKRIIKLLSNECECDGTTDGWNYCLAHKTIDIIKAENK